MANNLKEGYFLADNKNCVEFYHLLQVEHDLKESFSQCGYEESSIVEDVLVAVAVWIKDSQLNEKEKLTVQDVIALIVKILTTYEYKDVVEVFQTKVGFSILSEQKLYKKLNNVLQENNLQVAVTVKTRVYQQLTKLGYRVNDISTNLIRAITLEELRLDTLDKRQVRERTFNKSFPQWVSHSFYGHIFSSLRLDIDMEKIFEGFLPNDFSLDLLVFPRLWESFGLLAKKLNEYQNQLLKLDYFYLRFRNLNSLLKQKDIDFYIQQELYSKFPNQLVIKTKFEN